MFFVSLQSLNNKDMTKIHITLGLKKIPLQNNKYYYANAEGEIYSTFMDKLHKMKFYINIVGMLTHR
jgi:hypothetical protein